MRKKANTQMVIQNPKVFVHKVIKKNASTAQSLNVRIYNSKMMKNAKQGRNVVGKQITLPLTSFQSPSK